LFVGDYLIDLFDLLFLVFEEEEKLLGGDVDGNME